MEWILCVSMGAESESVGGEVTWVGKTVVALGDETSPSCSASGSVHRVFDYKLGKPQEEESGELLEVMRKRWHNPTTLVTVATR